MCLFRVSPEMPGYEQHIYECDPCQHRELVVIESARYRLTTNDETERPLMFHPGVAMYDDPE
jgi:hypothetical protein